MFHWLRERYSLAYTVAWEKEAYGKERFMMSIIYILDMANKEPNK